MWRDAVGVLRPSRAVRTLKRTSDPGGALGGAMERIVMGIDLTESAQQVAQWGSSFLDQDGEAVLVHVLSGGPLPNFLREIVEGLTTGDEQIDHEASSSLEELAREIPARTAVRVVRGQPATALARVGREVDADLVVIGPRGGRASRLGTTAEQLVRIADRPVLVVRGPRGEAPSRLLLAVDASVHSADVLRHGRALMDHFNASATVLHVLDENLLIALRTAAEGSPAHRHSTQGVSAARSWVEEQVRLHELPGGRVKVEAVFGGPIHEIAARTEEGGHDLVVMGSRGLGGIRREVLGSVTSGVLRAAWCPVLVV